jgi:hypothetical protein
VCFFWVFLVIPSLDDVRELSRVAVEKSISMLCGYDYLITVGIARVFDVGSYPNFPFR